MARERERVARRPRRSGAPVKRQASAGGLVARRSGEHWEAALVGVGDPMRWQLPKGLIDEGETAEETAIREVREEAGIEAAILEPLGDIEYWYQAKEEGKPVRYHKVVRFFLMEYRSGDVTDHDWEVKEARWVPLDQAAEMLAFEGEKEIGRRAVERVRRPGTPR